jgi:hypothetical protein
MFGFIRNLVTLQSKYWYAIFKYAVSATPGIISFSQNKELHHWRTGSSWFQYASVTTASAGLRSSLPNTALVTLKVTSVDANGKGFRAGGNGSGAVGISLPRQLLPVWPGHTSVAGFSPRRPYTYYARG